MIVRDLAHQLDLRVLAGQASLDRTVTGGYVCDLLSCVMAGAAAGNVWVTVQAHANVVAVASLVGMSAVVVSEGAAIEPNVLERADREGIPILSCARPSFELVAAMSDLGIKGRSS